jgi:DNA-binding winged helix-turn-helix (wHTH) protein/tetratricopeptide (TPR) repeat protein
MNPDRAIAFGPFVVDLDGELLLRDGAPVALRPKTWAVLRYLVERPGSLVTKDELLDGIWPDVTVGDELPGVSVKELRTALGDDARAPRFIATIHRRGYRFIGNIGFSGPPVLRVEAPRSIVGRDVELGRLREWLECARAGERRIVFVGGEAGIGKTTLVETFLAGGSLPDRTPVGRGQCLQHHGPGEPFLPVLEALGRLRTAPDGDRVSTALRRRAPLWLPWITGAGEPAEQPAIGPDAGATPERMVRTLAEALEMAATDSLLVLLLEDLHWSDPSTIDLLGRLAFRPEPARLLVIGTFRPVELVVSRHPLADLRRHLRTQRRCHELLLDFLGEEPTASFLATRFPDASIPDGLPAWVRRRSDGNPLFMTHIVEALEAQGVARNEHGHWTLSQDYARVEVPDTLQALMDQHLHALPPAQREVLEAASVVGPSHSAAAVAAATDADVAVTEQACEAVARETHLVRRDGDSAWPDGTIAARYTFVHSVYREALERSVPPARRARFHLRIAERLESAWSVPGAEEIAGDLALHYERGGDVVRAARHHERAADLALTRQAPREALMHLDAALALRERLPTSPERAQETIRALIARGWALVVADGHTTRALETYERARALCPDGHETPQTLLVLAGLSIVYRLRGDLPRARASGEEALAVARRLGGFPLLLAAAYIPLASAELFAGDIGSAHALGETTVSLLADLPDLPAFARALDARVAAIAHVAVTLMLLGHAAEARQRLDEALALARRSRDAITLLATLVYGSLVASLRRDWPMMRALTEESIALACDAGIGLFDAVARAFRGHALAAEGKAEAIEELGRALDDLRAAGVEAGRPSHLGMLAVVHANRGDAAAGLRLLDEALEGAASSGERLAEPELHRLRATIVLAGAGDRRRRRATALDSLERALDVARAQGSRWLELRAATDLARLWSGHHRADDARALLDAILERHPDDIDLPDLREARALRHDLARR